MNETKRRGFLEGTLMEQSMNFFFLISVWASGPCSESWFRKQKKHAAAKEQRRKKNGKEIRYFCRISKIFRFGTFLRSFSCLFFFFPMVSFFLFFIINILLSLKLESEKYKCLIYKWKEGKRTGMQDSGIE